MNYLRGPDAIWGPPVQYFLKSLAIFNTAHIPELNEILNYTQLPEPADQ
jgi:hypothetical protein